MLQFFNFGAISSKPLHHFWAAHGSTMHGASNTVLAGLALAAAASRGTALPAATPVFEAGIGGFPCVRVPSLLAVPHGPLLAFAECRHFTGDGCEPQTAAGAGVQGSADLRDRVVCMRASSDGGVTWGALQPNISRGWGMYPTAVYDATVRAPP